MYLVGAKGHGKVILDILEDLEIKVDGFLDVDESINSVYQYKVLHSFPNERDMFI